MRALSGAFDRGTPTAPALDALERLLVASATSPDPDGASLLDLRAGLRSRLGRTEGDAAFAATLRPLVLAALSARSIEGAPADIVVVERGELVFDHVDFGYDLRRPILKDVSFRIAPGHTVAVVGPSGAGKSTLSRLLFRFYDVNGGRILIDGQDIADVTQDSLRATIGMVTQDTSLLHRSVRDNISYGRPEADEASVREAAAVARADRFIAGLIDPRGRRSRAVAVVASGLTRSDSEGTEQRGKRRPHPAKNGR